MTLGARRVSPGVRAARLLAQAVTLGWLAYVLTSWFLVWNPADGGAYYDAAVRLRNGEELYHEIHPEAHEAYRYAPWFAYAWVPLSFLPRDAAIHGWSLAMLGCSAIAVWPIARLGTPAAISLAALLGAFLAETAMFGNAHPAVVALLSLSARRSSTFGFAVGIGASIKLVPILFVGAWLGKREWTPALIAIGVTAALWAPALLFDLTNYVTSPGTGLLSLYAVSPLLWLITALTAAAIAAIMIVRKSRWAWIALAVAMFLGPPRIALSYLAFLAPAVAVTLAHRSSRIPPGMEPARTGRSTSGAGSTVARVHTRRGA
jgi:hypothetical protein